mmetsp:Transcript_40907/g.102348  ORF Transcript_40907/g.102348 Transcript_40907/m.102348 type:complete len:118 (+) Transcript_40907:2-355(+)
MASLFHRPLLLLLGLQIASGFSPTLPALQLRAPFTATPSRAERCVVSLVEKKQGGVQREEKKDWLERGVRTGSRVQMEGTDCRFPPHEPCEASGRCRVDGQRCSIRRCKEEFKGKDS